MHSVKLSKGVRCAGVPCSGLGGGPIGLGGSNVHWDGKHILLLLGQSFQGFPVFETGQGLHLHHITHPTLPASYNHSSRQQPHSGPDKNDDKNVSSHDSCRQSLLSNAANYTCYFDISVCVQQAEHHLPAVLLRSNAFFINQLHC